jgi:hypothetical protein
VKLSLIAVLTGDIVGSQKIAPQNYDNMLYTLESTFSMLSSKIKVQYDLFRGDAFQAIFFDPKTSIKSAIILRLALKTATPSFDARQCIGIGSVASLRSDSKSSTGEAFTLSGKGLDNIKTNHMLINTKNSNFQTKTALVTRFMDNHLGDLTVTQAETLLCYLTSDDKSHDSIASALGKNRSNVTRLLNASRYQLVADYINHFELCITEDFCHG